MDIKTIIEAIKYINGIWKKPIGFLCSCVVMIAVLMSFSIKTWWILLCACVALLVFWLLQTNRIYFRSRWLSFVWLIGLLGISSFFRFWLYPKYISNTNVDLVGIQVWGTAIVFVLSLTILLILQSKIFKKGKLLVILFVDNKSSEVELYMRDIVQKAVNNIMDEQSDIRIVVPTFGICSRLKVCENYMCNPFTRADAFIRTDVVDDSSDGRLNYIFTNFTSRINPKRVYSVASPHSILQPVDEVQKYRDWNNRNETQSGLSSKVRIGGNIENMLRMYVASIYMLKNKYSIAISVADKMYTMEQNNTPMYNLACEILGSSYLSAAQEEEHSDHDYKVAYSHLKTYIAKFPSQSRNNQYIQAMARIHFYLDNIRESKRYTRSIKDLNNPDSTWSYNLNMGFYALYEKKNPEFVSWYKKLYSLNPGKYQVEFAIQFLTYEQKRTDDNEYSISLDYAIAFLTLFLNYKRAKRLWTKAKVLHSRSDFKKLEDLVNKTTKTLKTS